MSVKLTAKKFLIPANGSTELIVLGADTHTIFAYEARERFYISMDGDEPVPMQESELIRQAPPLDPIKTIQLHNHTNADMRVTLNLGDGRIERYTPSEVRLKTGSEALGVGSPDIEVGDTPVLIAPANSSRVKITIFNGADILWIGGAGNIISDTLAGKIQSNGSVEIETRGDIYGVRSSGSNAPAGYLEEIGS